MTPLLAELWLSPPEWQAVRLSLLVAIVAVLGSLPLGIAMAWLLARREFFGKVVLETAINLPLVMPPVVTGYLLLWTFGQRGWLGRRLDEWFGLQFVFDWKGAALAAAIVSFPLMVRSIRVALSMVDPEMEGAARNLGASGASSFLRVTLPMAQNGVVAGCVLAFARSLGEFGATIMIAGSIPGETRTIPLYVYQILETPGGETTAVRVVIVSILLSAAALYASSRLERPRQG